MSDIQILMPMGGLGSRFAEAGYETPKALISVDGKPMFKRALDSFKSVPTTSHIFVIRQEHENAYGLSNEILKELPSAKIIVMHGNTRGAVETALLASDCIDDGKPIIVADCDIYFESKDYVEKVQDTINTGKPDGMLLTFMSNDPRYSYVEIDSKCKAIRTAEKVVISNHAILGGYFFANGKLFKDVANEFVGQSLPTGLKEYFMSHLFNMLIKRGLQIEIANVDTMYIFGTPEELNSYFKEHPQS